MLFLQEAPISIGEMPKGEDVYFGNMLPNGFGGGVDLGGVLNCVLFWHVGGRE